MKAKKLVPHQFREYGSLAASGLYNNDVRIVRRAEMTKPTEDDKKDYEAKFDNLLHPSMRVIRLNTPKRDVIDLITSPYTPTKQKTQSPKPKKSYKKGQMRSPHRPPSAEKQSDYFMPKRAQEYREYCLA